MDVDLNCMEHLPLLTPDESDEHISDEHIKLSK